VTVDLQTLETSLHATWMQALAGHAPSYEKALSAISGHLRAFLKRRLYSRPQDVEDLVQETLLAIHQKRHTYQSDQPLTAWVYAIARYKLIDHLRAHARRDCKHDDIDDWAEQLWVSDDNDAGNAQRDVHQLLSELPEKQRVPIEHTKLQGLSIVESAQLTGQSVAAVKVNIHRGLKTLAQKFGASP
jgi:RNA polymerase sigma-70 factor (ECF subfamily)